MRCQSDMDGFAGSKTANNRPASYRAPWDRKQRSEASRRRFLPAAM